MANDYSPKPESETFFETMKAKLAQNKPVKLSDEYIPYSGDHDMQQKERSERIRKRLGL